MSNIKRNAKSACVAWKQDFYKLSRWRSIRAKAIKLYGEQCHCCGKKGPSLTKNKKTKPLHVDHIKPRSTHPELAFYMSNLQILCERCNTKKSNKHTTDYRPHEHVALCEQYVRNPKMLQAIVKQRNISLLSDAERASREKQIQQAKDRKKSSESKPKLSKSARRKNTRKRRELFQLVSALRGKPDKLKLLIESNEEYVGWLKTHPNFKHLVS